MREPEQPRTHVLTLWKTEEQARDFVEFVQGRGPEAEKAGVRYESMTVGEVVGEAHR